VLDDSTPLESFSIPLNNARSLMITSTSDYSWTRFSLADAKFTDQAVTSTSSFLVASGQGFVQFMPIARQAMMHTYHPGESVPIKAYFGGSAQEAIVTIRVKPEQDVAPEAFTATLPLQRETPRISSGMARWQVPAHRGPAQLEVECPGSVCEPMGREVGPCIPAMGADRGTTGHI
jgi:hypothetical protein